jgi:hypothetical protein
MSTDDRTVNQEWHRKFAVDLFNLDNREYFLSELESVPGLLE